MFGATASCSIALNVCQILEIDLEKLLRGGNSIVALTLDLTTKGDIGKACDVPIVRCKIRRG